MKETGESPEGRIKGSKTASLPVQFEALTWMTYRIFQGNLRSQACLAARLGP